MVDAVLAHIERIKGMALMWSTALLINHIYVASMNP